VNLRKSNPYLRDLNDDAALLVAARSSSAVEGIRGVFRLAPPQGRVVTSGAPIKREVDRVAAQRR
jgi:hypothetical protein